MKIAVSGKGGSGKTTLSATLARLFARKGFSVMVIDGDPNPNLGAALGLGTLGPGQLKSLPRSILEERPDSDGVNQLTLTQPISVISSLYGVKGPDDITLLQGGMVEHAGKG